MKLFVERLNCPVCKSKTKEVLITKSIVDKDFLQFIKLEPTYKNAFYQDLHNGILSEQIFEVVKCGNCHFIYQRYILDDLGMNLLYNKWMDHYIVNSLSGTPEIIAKRMIYYQDRIAYVQDHFKRKSINILDWGAGLGNFCMAASTMNPGDNFAYDFSTEKNSHLENRGIIVRNLDTLPKAHFDFINIDQVLEHVPDPLNLILNTLKFLRQDGLIFISVPLCNTVEKKLRLNKLDQETFGQLQPHQHINAFNNKTLKRIGFEAGIKPIFEPIIQIKTSVVKRNLQETIKNSLRPFYRQWFSTSLFFTEVCSSSKRWTA